MTHNDGCSKRRRVALTLARIWLSGYATGASDVRSLRACPPVVECSRAFKAQAAEERAFPPEGSLIAEMISDFAVIWTQAGACRV